MGSEDPARMLRGHLEDARKHLASMRSFYEQYSSGVASEAVEHWEQKVREYERLAAMDWSRPTPENGFMTPREDSTPSCGYPSGHAALRRY